MKSLTSTWRRWRARTVRGGLLLAACFLTAACNYQGTSGGGTSASQQAEDDDDFVFIDPDSAGDAGITAFAETAHPLLVTYCQDCHANGPGSPSIANADAQLAYAATVNNQKINLATPANSRLVRRLVADFHHCWSDCVSDGAEMQAAIAAWAALVVSNNEQVVSVEDGVRTGSLQLDDGVEDTGAERYSANQIALWEFKDGSGEIALDTSGVEPAMDLRLSGDARFLSSYGIAFEEGKAAAAGDRSRKLYDYIASPATGSQQYSIEAWVVPANVSQEGPARIATYSSGTGLRNFTLGQVLYTYDFRNRSLAPEVNLNGTPALTTYDGDQDLQDSQQHVVLTYDQFRGRRIYVNAEFTDDEDPQGAARLWSWDSNFQFVLGNETNDSRPWEGQIRLAAVYDHALTEAQIQQNFNAGVGKRVLLRFDVSAFLGAGSYIEFTVSELDDFSYLLCQPTLVTPNPSGFVVSNLRIAVNGQVSVSGQAFSNLQAVITSPKQELSRQCSVIAKDQGPLIDGFSIEFDALGAYTSLPPEPVEYPLPSPGVVQDLPSQGIRDFARLNATMASVTGVDANRSAVKATWTELQQQLPGSFDLRAFSSSNQVGIAKLALEYCDALVGDPTLRSAFFGPAFDFNVPATTAFAGSAARDQVLLPLSDRFLGSDLADQPDPSEVRAVLDGLIDELVLGCDAASCGPERTRTVVKATCAALLSSAAVSVH